MCTRRNTLTECTQLFTSYHYHLHLCTPQQLQYIVDVVPTPLDALFQQRFKTRCETLAKLGSHDFRFDVLLGPHPSMLQHAH
ncbi:hypothetical protein SCLCIDRAFT_26385 [Scleroderma citrinum Foug A]|uniref:Uncharacterized protein n=1 Tax=Scleroderma citrinum Foug A TaxID=1036808 RepID=A0A0C3DJ42_9AGAM|nr:hypothetical protein SCLCIDRAFT_26385 [Scleroderma citrinum Foug A]